MKSIFCSILIIISIVGQTFAAQPQEFQGKIAKSYEDSKEWWAPKVTPPEGAPNIIIFLLDDVGFAQIGSFGGLIKTPNIDKYPVTNQHYFDFVQHTGYVTYSERDPGYMTWPEMSGKGHRVGFIRTIINIAPIRIRKVLRKNKVLTPWSPDL